MLQKATFYIENHVVKTVQPQHSKKVLLQVPRCTFAVWSILHASEAPWLQIPNLIQMFAH